MGVMLETGVHLGDHCCKTGSDSKSLNRAHFGLTTEEALMSRVRAGFLPGPAAASPSSSISKREE